MKKDLITLKDMTREEFAGVMDLAFKMKAGRKKYQKALSGKTLGLVFQKPSNRTRVSFAVGMMQLGGEAIYLGPDEIKLGKRESPKDVSAVLSRYLDGLVVRTFKHQDIVEMAKYARIPVINGLSDSFHPCQALADIFTIYEHKGRKNVTIAYVGDGNNVLHSLIFAASQAGLPLRIATPGGYEPSGEVLRQARELAPEMSGELITLTNDAREAVSGADVIYTDVWTSMGQEDESRKREEIFAPFRLDGALAGHAKADCIFMHCLPAHRGHEITDDIIDSPRSVVYDQAENRLHVQKAILYLYLKNR